jgi:hypothetical protein
MREIDTLEHRVEHAAAAVVPPVALVERQHRLELESVHQSTI